MASKSNLPKRKNLRLKGYDYSLSGAYFITVVTHKRKNHLGKITAGKLVLSRPGKIAQHIWHNLPNHYPRVQLGAFVIMPNHIHGIIVLKDMLPGGSDQISNERSDKMMQSASSGNVSSETRPYNELNVGLPEIVRAFKSFSSRNINKLERTQGKPFWQRGYHDRIIRNEKEWGQIQDYILANPLNWHDDTEYRE